MKAFVTGGSGFLGRTLIRFLTEKGETVRALARSDGAAEAVRGAGAEPVRGDLGAAAALRDGMRGCDVVFHAAAKVDDWGPRSEFQDVTIDGTRRVVESARAAGVPRVVHVSTEAVLVGGPRMHNADESWPLPARPLGLYPWSKGRAEEIARAAGAVVVRPRFIWGKGDTVLVPRLAELGKRGRFAWIDGGHYPTSTCHVRNVCHGMLLAAEKGRPGEVYFLTDGEPVDTRQFISELVRRQTGVDLGAKKLPRWLARVVAAGGEVVWRAFRLKGAPPVTRSAIRLGGEEVTVSDAKARRELGYRPIVTREQGLAEVSP